VSRVWSVWCGVGVGGRRRGEERSGEGMVVELWQSWEVDLRFVQYRSQTYLLQVTDTHLT